MDQITQILKDLASGTKGIKPVYTQFKVAKESMDIIFVIEDPEFQKAMQTKYETSKFTDKSALKKLNEDLKSI